MDGNRNLERGVLDCFCLETRSESEFGAGGTLDDVWQSNLELVGAEEGL